MSKKRKPPKSLTQTDHIADAVSAGSCQLVLDTSPPDYVVEISRYLESSVKQSGPDENPPGTDSDSADSLFITQKPVPEAVRSGKRRHSSFGSDLTSPTELEDDEDDCMLASQREAKTKTKRSRRRRRRTVFNLPEYHFSFLKEKMWKPDVRQKTGLHNSVAAGFFECVRELGKSYHKGQDLQASLPTLDVDGGYISPISQHEEMSEDEDIRVVERKQFVFSSKPKSSQPWYAQGNTVSQVKRHRKIKEPCDKARHETSHKIPDMTSTLSAPLPVEAESNQHVKTDISVGQRETSNAKTGRKKLLFPQKEKEDELCKDSDATLSDLSPEKRIPKRGETSPTLAQPRGDVFHTAELSQTEQGECEPDSQSLLQTDANNDTLCSETGLQRRREKKHGGDHQSTEEPAAQHATPTENMEIREVEETQVSQAIDEAESHEKDWTKQTSHDDNMLTQMDISETKRKKKKKREQPETEEVQQETEAEVRAEEDSVTNKEDEGKKKKKKKKRKRSVEADEPLKEGAEIEEKKAPNMNSDHMSEQFEAPQEAESSYIKRKKHKKKQKSVSNNDTQAEQDCTDANVCNDDVTLAETLSKKKKKTKKRIAEQIDVSHTEESTTEAFIEPNAEPVTKKKKQKKKKKKSNVDDGDAVAQSDDSVSVWKKEKKRTSSFLLADAEQTAAQKREKKPPASPSPSETTHVWHAEKPAVSNGDFTTELAEMPASLEESEEGVRKKKKKKKEKNNVKPNETPERDLTEIQVKLKKKQKKDESVTETSDAGCQIDEDVVSKKKKKKKRKDTQEIPPAATEEALVTCSSAVYDSSTCSEQVHKQMFEHALETPGNMTLNDVRDKKKKKKKKQTEVTLTDEMAAQENDNKLEVDSLLSEFPHEKSSSHSFMKNKHKKRLHNPKEDFLDAEAT